MNRATAARRRLRQLLQRRMSIVLVLPAMTFMVLTLIYPMVFSLVVSFKHYDLSGGLDVLSMPGAGFRNYALVLSDPAFLSSVGTTVIVLAIAFPLEMVAGFGLALAIDGLGRDRLGRLYSTAILVPLMVPTIAASLIWRMLLNSQYGLVDSVLRHLHLPTIDFLGQAVPALAALIVVDVWQWTPFVFLILLAGVRSLPVEVYEAAQVDGASWFSRLRHVTIPLMAWPILLVVLIRGGDLIRLFDYSFGLTFGGPGYATETMSFYTYLKSFQNFQLDRGAASSWLLFIVIYGASLLILRTRRAREAWS